MTVLSTVVGHALPSAEREPVRLPPLAYRAIAAVGVALAIAAVAVYGPGWRGVAAAAFCLALAIVTAADLEYRLIPNRVVLPATVIVLPLMTLAEPTPEWALAALGAGALLLVAALVYPAGMGMGDVKLAVLMGAALGRGVIPALVLAVFMAAVPALALLVRHGSAGRTIGIPFGPFLALGSVVVLFAAA
jgi:leader peptidase (prepilin peptidase)/N-methyltransferase